MTLYQLSYSRNTANLFSTNGFRAVALQPLPRSSFPRCRASRTRASTNSPPANRCRPPVETLSLRDGFQTQITPLRPAPAGTDGEGGIRTHETVAGLRPFQGRRLSRFRTSPLTTQYIINQQIKFLECFLTIISNLKCPIRIWLKFTVLSLKYNCLIEI